MPAVRSSTGQPITVRCTDQLARRLGMIHIGVPRQSWPEPHRLVFVVAAGPPNPPPWQTYLWPAQPGLGTEDC